MEETIAVTSTSVPPAAPPSSVARSTPVVTGASSVPRQGAEPEPMGEHAVRYAEERHWDVVPGTWLQTVDGGAHPRCSCGEATCEAPGAHPLNDRWAGDATGSAAGARRMWAKVPRASVLLPTGRTFDAVDVPETAGCLALARMQRLALPLSPVVATPDGRMLFFVLPGAAGKVPALVRALGWSPGALDLATLGEGGWVPAPPTRVGTKGCVQWACPPTAANRLLPDVEEVLAPLAYASGREAATARAR